MHLIMTHDSWVMTSNVDVKLYDKPFPVITWHEDEDGFQVIV